MLLDAEGELLLLDMYNETLTKCHIPSTWTEARVDNIFKGKGSDTDVANYRPISLLNTAYKLFATMMQTRLANLSETKLRSTQFGFRAGKGTRQPLFIVRRAIEWSNMTNKPLHLLFLDWQQAFDSIDHTAMLEALYRFGVPQNYINLIEQFYTLPTFQFESWSELPAKGKVSAGIRQGCPLSPYLFVIVLSVIVTDLEEHLLQTGQPCNTWSVGRPTYDLEYADDTLLMSLTIPQTQAFLTGLEKEASRYGMQLNDETKTEILSSAPQPDPVFFSSGEPVEVVGVVKYLGSMVSFSKSFEVAFMHRLGVAETAYKKMRLVWNCNMPRRRKIKLFMATFVPCLTYGLDALTLTTKDLKRIDGQVYRFLRRAIGIKASFYSRISNAEVWEQASRPRRPSETLHKTQYKMTREVYCSNMDNPVHNVVFCTGFKDRIYTQGRRRGMQFPYWVETTLKRYQPGLSDHTAGIGHNDRYVQLYRILRSTPEMAPKRARPNRKARAWP